VDIIVALKKVIWFRRRWAPWWLAIGAAVCFIPLVFLKDGARGLDGRFTTEIRVIIALVTVAAYWILGVVANWRVAIVRPAGVRTSMFPFPTGSGQRVRRDGILHSYARHHVETDESNSYVVADYYAMGVETIEGHQLDIHLPYGSEAEALDAAREVARVLNINASGRRIDVRPVETKLTYPTLRRLVVFWSVATLCAVYIGWR